MGDTIDIRINLQPVTASGAIDPFAWHVEIQARPQMFHTVDAILPAEDRAALEGLRLQRALAAAAEADIDASGALLIVPIHARAGSADRLLAHLFRAALLHRFPLDRLIVEIAAGEDADRDAATTLIHACADRGLMVALSGFAAGPLALGLLAHCSPRLIRLDAGLARRLDTGPARARIVEGVLRLARGMGVTVVAPTPEHDAERTAALAAGLRHFHGADRPRAAASLRQNRPVRRWGAPVLRAAA